MANFIARVELHSASYDDYERLHLYMQQRGYLRAIKNDEGKTYQLPTGTYVSSGRFSSGNEALIAAVAAANVTGKNSAIIVADWNSASWQGLPIVTTARTA